MDLAAREEGEEYAPAEGRINPPEEADTKTNKEEYANTDEDWGQICLFT